MAKKITTSLLSFYDEEHSTGLRNELDDNVDANVQINYGSSTDTPTIAFRPTDPEKLINYANKIYLHNYPDIQCFVENSVDENDNENYDYLFMSDSKPEWYALNNAISLLVTDFFDKIPYSFHTNLKEQWHGKNVDYKVNLKTNNKFSLTKIEKFTRRILRTYVLFHKREIFLNHNLDRIASVIRSNNELQEFEKQLLMLLPPLENAFVIFNGSKYLTVLLTFKTKTNHKGERGDDLIESTKSWINFIGSKATSVSQIISSEDKFVYSVIKDTIKKINRNSEDNTKHIDSFKILYPSYSLKIEKKNIATEIPKILERYKLIIDEIYWSVEKAD